MRKLLRKLKPVKLFLKGFDPIKDLKASRRRSRAGRKVLIDCGANTGKVFETFYKSRQDFECYLFEPQPELSEPLTALIEKYQGKDISLIKKAVWIKDEKLKFYLATQWGENYKGGSSLLEGHAEKISQLDYETPVEVEGIDFTKWFEETVQPSEEDYVMMKMDIEGAEYEVLEKMIAKDLMKYVSELIIEFHFHMNDTISAERHQKLEKALRNQKGLKLTIWH